MLESVNNERVKNISKLNDKKYRYKDNLFLAPGKHLVVEAIKKGIVKELFLLSGEENIYGIDVTYVSDAVMKKMVNLDNPPKELAVCYIQNNDEIKGNVVVLDDVRDPGNLGTIIRSAVAFNYETIILSKNCVDVYNSKVIRATEGMLFNVNIIVGDLFKLTDTLISKGYTLYATDVVLGDNPERCLDKHALYIGSEANGLKEDLKQKCHKKLKIEMNPLCESLNAGVSASILMYELGGKK